MPTTTPLGPRSLDHWTAALPSVLQRAAGQRALIVLSQRFAGELEARCHCDGILADVRGVWRHIDTCRACRTATTTNACTGRHIGCSQPEPVRCLHGCGEIPDVDARCLLLGAGHADCCGCCTDLTDRPDLDGRDLRR